KGCRAPGACGCSSLCSCGWLIGVGVLPSRQSKHGRRRIVDDPERAVGTDLDAVEGAPPPLRVETLELGAIQTVDCSCVGVGGSHVFGICIVGVDDSRTVLGNEQAPLIIEGKAA